MCGELQTHNRCVCLAVFIVLFRFVWFVAFLGCTVYIYAKDALYTQHMNSLNICNKLIFTFAMLGWVGGGGAITRYRVYLILIYWYLCLVTVCVCMIEGYFTGGIRVNCMSSAKESN